VSPERPKLGRFVIDLHCHVLPGIDDGPGTMEESLALARAAAEAGTRTLVATPHVSWDWNQNGSLIIADGVLMLKRALREAGVAVEIRRGAEIALTRAADLADDELGRLGLAGGPWLLIECPYSASALGFETTLSALEARGHHILLAHPERIVGFQKDLPLLEWLVARGMLCQLTASSLTGRFGREVQRFSRTLLQNGLAHVVASDAHSVTGRPPDVLTELRDAGLPGEQIRWMTELMPQALLEGAPLPDPPLQPPPPPPRAGLGQLFRRSA